MKKVYATPTLVTSGSVVRDTLNGVLTGAESDGKQPKIGGSVGFYL